MGNGIMWMENFINNFNLVVTLNRALASSPKGNLFQGLFNEKDADPECSGQHDGKAIFFLLRSNKCPSLQGSYQPGLSRFLLLWFRDTGNV